MFFASERVRCEEKCKPEWFVPGCDVGREGDGCVEDGRRVKEVQGVNSAVSVSITADSKYGRDIRRTRVSMFLTCTRLISRRA